MKKTIVIMALGLALLGSLLLAAPARKMIQIKGSDTMVNLVQILAEEYMGKTPGAAIAVLGGGSGHGHHRPDQPDLRHRRPLPGVEAEGDRPGLGEGCHPQVLCRGRRRPEHHRQ